MIALEAPSAWPANPFDREAQDITRTALPCLGGLIAAIRTRLSPLKLGRFNAGTFGTPRLHDANQSRSCLFTSFHAVSPFVCAAAHVEQHAAKDGRDVVKEGPWRVDV